MVSRGDVRQITHSLVDCRIPSEEIRDEVVVFVDPFEALEEPDWVDEEVVVEDWESTTEESEVFEVASFWSFDEYVGASVAP